MKAKRSSKASKESGPRIENERRSKRLSKASKKSETEISEIDDEAASRTPNEQAIDAYLAAVNRREPMEELLKHFTSKDVPVLMEDNPPVNALFLLTEICKCYTSFPDLAFGSESIKEVRPGEVLMEEMRVTGTHTGPAFGFAVFPPVPTTNKHVVLDPERLWFTLKDGKIDKIEVIALGNLTGPAGLYLSIGGKMDMPPPSP